LKTLSLRNFGPLIHLIRIRQKIYPQNAKD
jgi:hypothetical protein